MCQVGSIGREVVDTDVTDMLHQLAQGSTLEDVLVVDSYHLSDERVVLVAGTKKLFTGPTNDIAFHQIAVETLEHCPVLLAPALGQHDPKAGERTARNARQRAYVVEQRGPVGCLQVMKI